MQYVSIIEIRLLPRSLHSDAAWQDSDLPCGITQPSLALLTCAAELSLPTEHKKKFEGQAGIGAPEDLPVDVKPAVKHVISKELQVSQKRCVCKLAFIQQRSLQSNFSNRDKGKRE